MYDKYSVNDIPSVSCNDDKVESCIIKIFEVLDMVIHIKKKIKKSKDNENK